MVAKWQQVYNLDRPKSTIGPKSYEVELFRGTDPGNFDSAAPAVSIENISAALDLPYLFDGSDWVEPFFKMKITNKSGTSLWFSLLYLGDRYEMEVVMPNVHLAHGESTWFTDHLDQFESPIRKVLLGEEYHFAGLTQVREYLKLLVSRREVKDIFDWQQEPMEWEDYLDGPYRALSRGPQIDYDDWKTDLFELSIAKPLPLADLADSSFFSELGIILEIGSGAAGRYGLCTFEDALPNIVEGQRIVRTFEDGTLFQPCEITLGLKGTAGLSVICLYEIADDQLLSEGHPMTIRFTGDQERVLRPKPYSLRPDYSGFYELKHKWRHDTLLVTELPKIRNQGRWGKGYGEAHHIFLHF